MTLKCAISRAVRGQGAPEAMAIAPIRTVTMQKRRARNVKGSAYWRPSLAKTKPVLHKRTNTAERSSGERSATLGRVLGTIQGCTLKREAKRCQCRAG